MKGSGRGMGGVSRLGEILVSRGLLDAGQVEAVVAAQRNSSRPFGLLAEEMFGLSREAVEKAWVEQYAMLVQHIDPIKEKVDPGVLGVVSRRQAWQFQVLPVRVDGGEVMVVTSPEHLARAIRFATACLATPVFFVLADAHKVREAIDRYYPMRVSGHPLMAG